MKTITKADYSLTGDYTLSAFASDLGLAPGQWPLHFWIQGFGTFQHEKVLRDGARRFRVPNTKFTFTIYND